MGERSFSARGLEFRSPPLDRKGFCPPALRSRLCFVVNYPPPKHNRMFGQVMSQKSPFKDQARRRPSNAAGLQFRVFPTGREDVPTNEVEAGPEPGAREIDCSDPPGGGRMRDSLQDSKR